MRFLLSSIIVLFTGFSAFAGEADVLGVKATKKADHSYKFSVTVKHADAGWDHYIDKWDIVDPDGKVLATRVLAHPHVDEQPFTRSLSNVKIPKGIKYVTIRAHDSVHGYGSKKYRVEFET